MGITYISRIRFIPLYEVYLSSTWGWDVPDVIRCGRNAFQALKNYFGETLQCGREYFFQGTPIVEDRELPTYEIHFLHRQGDASLNRLVVLKK